MLVVLRHLFQQEMAKSFVIFKLVFTVGFIFVNSKTLTNESLNVTVLNEENNKSEPGGIYNSKCTETDECGDTLFCRYGYCRCADFDYLADFKCVLKKALNETCFTSSECSGKLICIQEKCQCGSDLFWDGTQCNLKKLIDSRCNTISECRENLNCIEGTCRCSNKDYWSGMVCEQRKAMYINCTLTDECGQSLFCAHGYCQCASSDFWDGVKCLSRSSINSSCTLSEECSPSLQCIDGDCKCCSSKFWNGTRCVARLPFRSMCRSFGECQEGLNCQSYFCTCPASTYWNEHLCTERKSIHAHCISTEECELSLSCVHKKCQCSADEHWSGLICDKRKGLDMACNSDEECQSLYRCYDNTCQCKEGFYWDGIHCTEDCPSECSEVSSTVDGVYTICPKGSHRHMSVYCMMRGLQKWTVIQRRFDSSVEFYRPWAEYKVGFGSATGEYWLGNDNIHLITSNGNHKLSVYLEDYDGSHAYANYTTFAIGNEAEKYKLTISGYSGNAGDSLIYHHGEKFSTYDADNDSHSSLHCATRQHGAWWYNGCIDSNMNGPHNDSAKSYWWNKWKSSKSYRKSRMMIRK